MSHRKLVLSVSSSGRANGNFIFKNNKLIGLKATEMYVRKRVQVQTVDNSDNDYTANVWIWHTFESFVTREKKSNGANFTEKHHRAKNNTTSFQRGFSFVRIWSHDHACQNNPDYRLADWQVFSFVQTYVKFTRVLKNKRKAWKARVNVEVERDSTFTFTRVTFTRAVRTEKLRESRNPFKTR